MAYTYQRHFNLIQALILLTKILFICVIIISASCSSGKQANEKDDPVLRLEKSLDSVSQLLFQLEHQTLQTAIERANLLLEKPEIMVNIPAFESLETAITFFGTFEESRQSISKEIEYTLQQLANLRVTYSERKLNQQQFMLYIQDEEKAVNNIELATDYLLNRFNAQLLLLQTLEEAYLQ